MQHRILTLIAIVTASAAVGCNSDGVSGARLHPGQGMLAVQLQDAPLTLDSIKEVNVYVERIDARRRHTDSAEVDDDLDVHVAASADPAFDHDDHARDSTVWVTIATPDTTFNLLKLRDGVTAFLGATAIDTGHFKTVRLVIDASKSNVVLKDGTVLTTTSTPALEFENRGRHAIGVELEDSLEVSEGSTTTLTLDLKLEQSLTLRGRSFRDGLFFRPVVAGRSHRH